MSPDSLPDRLLPLVRTRAELYRRGAANSHGRQMHEAVDILESAPDEPAVVFAVTQRAIASATKVIARADDSSGIIGDACRRLLALHARTSAAARPAPATLVDWMITFQFHGDVDYFTIDPAAYADALGEVSVTRYRRRLDEIAATLGPRPSPGTWWQSDHPHDWFVIEWNERRLAVHHRDVEAIIRTHSRDRHVAAWLEQTAKALEEIGETDLAIDWARQAAEFDGGHQARKAADYWCALLIQHRPDEILAARHWVFERWPNSSSAANLMTAAGDTWPQFADDVLDTLSRDPRQAVEFMLHVDVVRAWNLAHALELADLDVWLRLTDAYESIDPIAVLPVIEDAVRAILQVADARNYRWAATELARMRRLAEGTDRASYVEALIADLREENRRRPRLQTEFTRAGLP